VDGIFGCCESLYDIDLKKMYQEHTKPCIVKFIRKSASHRHIATALLYLYCRHRSLDIVPACNECYSGGGEGVKREDILKVEWLAE
jgi:hypothetical protein